MNIDQFLAKYQNKSNDFDGVYNAQCFDLFQFYNRDVVGGSFVSGNGAVDIWNTYPRALYEQIPNTPKGVPLKGDVVIWGTKYGQYGHVAICTEADMNKVTCLSQNDPLGSPTIYKTYTNWDQMLGWLHPKQTDTALQSCLSQHTDLVTQLEAVKSELKKATDSYSTQISSLNTEVLTLKQEVANRKEQVERLTSTYEAKVKGLEDKIKALTTLIDDTGAGIASYKDRIKILEGQVDSEAKEKGLVLIKVAELEGKLKEAINLYMVRALPFTDRLKYCLNILFT